MGRFKLVVLVLDGIGLLGLGSGSLALGAFEMVARSLDERESLRLGDVADTGEDDDKALEDDDVPVVVDVVAAGA